MTGARSVPVCKSFVARKSRYNRIILSFDDIPPLARAARKRDACAPVKNSAHLIYIKDAASDLELIRQNLSTKKSKGNGSLEIAVSL